MRKRKFTPYSIPSIEITTAGSEGKSIARHDEKVIMIDFGVPGDVVDVKVNSSKKSFSFATIQQIVKPSPDRVETFCGHFGLCGGCKWQQMSYNAQLKYKQQQVQDAFERIGKFEFKPLKNILGSQETTYYRNKCEYSFIDRKWVNDAALLNSLTPTELKGLGYHMPGRFDKIFDVEQCYLQPNLANEIRNSVRDFAKQHQYDFFNPYNQEGFLRNIILRNNEANEWMVIVCFKKEDVEKREALLTHIKNKFPAVKSLMYVINPKMNDTIQDLDVQLYDGDEFLIEKLKDLKFKIGPKSFFQTNTKQTHVLYSIAKTLAGLTGTEVVYDLYTGVGSIALFIANTTKKVVGIEYVEAAIVDAKINADLNQITNAQFYAGDMKDVLTTEFINIHGKPDVIITDPPRAGMHPDVIAKLLEVKAPKIVYVSCNPATQARDLAAMTDVYYVEHTQPVDMFPHTHHVENVVLLKLK